MEIETFLWIGLISYVGVGLVLAALAVLAMIRNAGRH
jgi:hypothetical protein